MELNIILCAGKKDELGYISETNFINLSVVLNDVAALNNVSMVAGEWEIYDRCIQFA